MEWISVKDAVPHHKIRVLTLLEIVNQSYPPSIEVGWREVFKNGAAKWKFFGWCGIEIACAEGKNGYYIITHWMPLPEPPK